MKLPLSSSHIFSHSPFVIPRQCTAMDRVVDLPPMSPGFDIELLRLDYLLPALGKFKKVNRQYSRSTIRSHSTC